MYRFGRISDFLYGLQLATVKGTQEPSGSFMAAGAKNIMHTTLVNFNNWNCFYTRLFFTLFSTTKPQHVSRIEGQEYPWRLILRKNARLTCLLTIDSMGYFTRFGVYASEQKTARHYLLIVSETIEFSGFFGVCEAAVCDTLPTYPSWGWPYRILS